MFFGVCLTAPAPQVELIKTHRLSALREEEVASFEFVETLRGANALLQRKAEVAAP